MLTSGETDKLQYKFVWQRNGSWAKGQWGVLQDFSSKNTAPFKLAANGTYTFYCDIRDSTGAVVTKTINYLPGETPLALEYVDLSSSSIQLGKTVTIKTVATALADVALTYKFVWMRDNWNAGNWGVISEGTSNTANFKPKTTGDYKIYCDVYAGRTQLTRTIDLPVWQLKGLNLSRIGATIVATPDMGALPSDLTYSYTYTDKNSSDVHTIAAHTNETAAYARVDFQPGYTVSVEVIDAAGNVVASASNTINMTLSEDAELDAKLDALAQRYDTLWKAYSYIAEFRYISGSKYPSGNWSVGFAKEMLYNNGGNCYRYAALMEWMAKALGYEAKAIAGYIPAMLGGYSPHGWTEIYIDGNTYICDAESYYEYPTRDFFLKTYENAPIAYEP